MAAALTAADVDESAAQLAGAAQSATPIDALIHEPQTVDDGYRIQAAGHRLHADALVGWKAGCTSDAAQQMFGIDAPLVGRYRSDHVLTSPAAIRSDWFPTAAHLEVEVGLRLLQDIEELPSDPLDLADRVEAFAAIEVVAGRLASFPLIGAALLAADNVVGARMIVGPRLDADPRALDQVPVELRIDGDVIAAGTGAEALGHPLRVLHLMLVHALALGEPLSAGDLFITGTCTGLVPARPGADHVGRVGTAAVRLTVD